MYCVSLSLCRSTHQPPKLIASSSIFHVQFSVGNPALVDMCDALEEYITRSDKDRSRKEAGKALKGTLTKLLEALDDGNGALERVMALLEVMVEPPYAKFKALTATTRAPGAAAAAAQGRRAAAAAAVQTYAPPAGYQLMPVPAAAVAPVAPEGYALVPVGASPARAAKRAASTSPPAGGKRAQIGISTLKPLESYPDNHFTKPCEYCTHKGHCGYEFSLCSLLFHFFLKSCLLDHNRVTPHHGLLCLSACRDNCWKTYPALRVANGIS